MDYNGYKIDQNPILYNLLKDDPQYKEMIRIKG